MDIGLKLPLLASFFLMIVWPAAGRSATGSAQAQRVSIHVYDHAQVPAGVLRSGLDEASRLFRAAQIEIHWEHPLDELAEDEGTDMTSVAFQQLDTRGYVVVRLIRGMPANVLPGALGYALPSAHKGAHVLIFYDRVETLARSLNESVDFVFGHAVAHEIGHVLLGCSEHASGGIMQARWTYATWHLASLGLLHFSREEVQGMGAGLQRFELHASKPVQRGALMSLSLSSRRLSSK